MTDKSKKLRAARIALQGIDPAKDLSDEETRRGLETDGIGATEIDEFFARVKKKAELRAGQMALEEARAARLAKRSPVDMLDKVRRRKLTTSELKKRIETFSSKGAQIAHRDLTSITHEDLESQYADLLTSAGAELDDEEHET